MAGVFNSCNVINDINTQTVLCSIKVVQLEILFSVFTFMPTTTIKK